MPTVVPCSWPNYEFV